jgi:hypothetical protein
MKPPLDWTGAEGERKDGFPQQFCRQVLKAGYRGVITENIIADLCQHHYFLHGARGPGLVIATEIDGSGLNIGKRV